MDERAEWGERDVRRLRRHLGETQDQFAARLGTRQQTVSQWETGGSRPRGMSRRLLRMVAEEAGYYEAGTALAERSDTAPDADDAGDRQSG